MLCEYINGRITVGTVEVLFLDLSAVRDSFFVGFLLNHTIYYSYSRINQGGGRRNTTDFIEYRAVEITAITTY